MRQLTHLLLGRCAPAPSPPPTPAEATRLRQILDTPPTARGHHRKAPIIVEYAPLPRTVPPDGILALLDCLPLMPTLNQRDALWPGWQAHAVEVVRHTLRMQPDAVGVALAQARRAHVTIRAALFITAPTAWQRDATRPRIEGHLAAALSAALGVSVAIDHDQTRWRTASGGAVSGWDATLWDGDWMMGAAA
jgi:hypothetical protein